MELNTIFLSLKSILQQNFTKAVYSFILNNMVQGNGTP